VIAAKTCREKSSPRWPVSSMRRMSSSAPEKTRGSTMLSEPAAMEVNRTEPAPAREASSRVSSGEPGRSSSPMREAIQ
jgi:hypothetical protein